MANDGVREFRIAALEKHMIDVVTAINALRNECASKAELAALSARVEKLEQEFKEFRIEFTARLEVIEATMVTKAELNQVFNRLIGIMIPVQIALNGGLYMLLRHAN
jgi:cell division protein FtsB